MGVCYSQKKNDQINVEHHQHQPPGIKMSAKEKQRRESYAKRMRIEHGLEPMEWLQHRMEQRELMKQSEPQEDESKVNEICVSVLKDLFGESKKPYKRYPGVKEQYAWKESFYSQTQNDNILPYK